MRVRAMLAFQVLLMACSSCGRFTEATLKETYDYRGVVYSRATKRPFTGVLVARDSDGSIRSRQTYRQGVADGPYCSWYENGQKDTEVEYDKGVPRRKWIKWRRDGSKRYDVEFNPEMSGVTSFFSTGEVWYRVQYDWSNKTSRILVYDKRGNLVTDGTEGLDVPNWKQTRNGTFCNRDYTVLVVEKYVNGAITGTFDKSGNVLDVGQLKKDETRNAADDDTREDLCECMFD